MSTLKWFVIWEPEFKSWSVKRGGFRDSIHESKYLAEQKADKLNVIRSPHAEGHLVDNYV